MGYPTRTSAIEAAKLKTPTDPETLSVSILSIYRSIYLPIYQNIDSAHSRHPVDLFAAVSCIQCAGGIPSQSGGVRWESFYARFSQRHKEPFRIAVTLASLGSDMCGRNKSVRICDGRPFFGSFFWANKKMNYHYPKRLHIHQHGTQTHKSPPTTLHNRVAQEKSLLTRVRVPMSRA